MAKKVGVLIVFAMVVVAGKLFAQELRITSVHDNGDYYDRAEWPKKNTTARVQWDSLFSKYNLVRIESDPFGSHSLTGNIAKMANNAL